MKITPQFLMAATRCGESLATRYAPYYEQALPLFEINTPYRLGLFFGQLAVESGGLRYVREIADGSAYEGRKDLGNDKPGDGRRYPGRGHIQITGKANYLATYERLARYGAPNFVDHPEELEKDQWAVYASCDWWHAHGLNALADRNDITRVSRAINRGNPDSDRPANHEAERFAATDIALSAVKKYRNEIFLDEVPQVSTSEPVTKPDVPIDQPPKPKQVNEMPLPIVPVLIGAIADKLIDAFTSLGRNKVRSAIEKHGGDPEVATQIVSTVVEAAKTITKQSDPMAAVVEAKKDPEIVQKIEDLTLDKLQEMIPLLEKLNEWELKSRELEEKAREVASERNLREVSAGGYDMTRPLVLDSLFGVNVLILIVAAVAVVQAIKTGKVDTEIWAAFTGLIGWRTAKAGTLYDYRFSGTTRTNASAIVETQLRKGQ